MPDDASLLLRAGAGDRAAFEIFARRWEAPLYRFLRRVTGSDSLAAEARQATLVRIYLRASTYRGGDVPVWVLRTAYRIASNLRRSEGRAVHAAIADEGRVPDSTPPPDVALADEEERQAVRRALDGLAPADRALLWLRFAEGLSGAEAARILRASPSTLRYRLERALRRLRRGLFATSGNGDLHAMR